MNDETKKNQTGSGAQEGPAVEAEKITPAGEPATDVPENDPMAMLETDLHRLQEERNALFEQLARVQADFRNAQKRLESEKMQAIQYGNSKLIASLLPIIDNFERAIETDPSKVDATSVLKGLQIIYDQLMSVLKQQHVEVVAPPVGTPFDPNQHEALMQQPDDRYEEPAVTQLLQKGYMLHGRMLRPAQVAVSKPQS